MQVPVAVKHNGRYYVVTTNNVVLRVLRNGVRVPVTGAKTVYTVLRMAQAQYNQLYAWAANAQAGGPQQWPPLVITPYY